MIISNVIQNMGFIIGKGKSEFATIGWYFNPDDTEYVVKFPKGNKTKLIKIKSIDKTEGIDDRTHLTCSFNEYDIEDFAVNEDVYLVHGYISTLNSYIKSSNHVFNVDFLKAKFDIDVLFGDFYSIDLLTAISIDKGINFVYEVIKRHNIDKLFELDNIPKDYISFRYLCSEGLYGFKGNQDVFESLFHGLVKRLGSNMNKRVEYQKAYEELTSNKDKIISMHNYFIYNMIKNIIKKHIKFPVLTGYYNIDNVLRIRGFKPQYIASKITQSNPKDLILIKNIKPNSKYNKLGVELDYVALSDLTDYRADDSTLDEDKFEYFGEYYDLSKFKKLLSTSENIKFVD